MVVVLGLVEDYFFFINLWIIVIVREVDGFVKSLWNVYLIEKEWKEVLVIYEVL